MAIYSAFNDDGITLMIHSESPEEAAQKAERTVTETGIEMDLDFFLDDITDSYVDDDKTVEQWLKEKNIDFSQDRMLIIDGDDVQVYEIEFTQ
jgi:hypothetical protein